MLGGVSICLEFFVKFYTQILFNEIIISYCFVDPPSKTIDDTTTEAFRSLLEFNLVSYFLMCKVS